MYLTARSMFECIKGRYHPRESWQSLTDAVCRWSFPLSLGVALGRRWSLEPEPMVALVLDDRVEQELIVEGTAVQRILGLVALHRCQRETTTRKK